MLHNFLILTCRRLWRMRAFTFVNLIGLSVAIASCILLSGHVMDELSYDRYHTRAERIFRLNLGNLTHGGRSAITSGAMARDFAQDFPEIVSYVRFKQFPSLIEQGESQFYEDRLFYADSTVFDVFDFTLSQGDQQTALDEPFSIVLTETAAKKYFGDASPLGRSLKIDNNNEFEVTGIMHDMPRNSHFTADFLAPISSLENHPDSSVSYWQLNSWFSHYYHTYLLLNSEADVKTLGPKIEKITVKYSNPEHFELYGRDMGLYLQPLTDIHLNPVFGELQPQGRRQNLYIFGIVALIILLIACSNYANLTTALALHRNREIGVRKALGENQQMLTSTFFGEAFLVTSISIILAVALTGLASPVFAHITGQQFEFNNRMWPVILAICMLTTFLGGLYPAYVSRSFSPIHIFRKDAQKIKGIAINKGLIIFQFVLSLGLIVSTFVVHSQLKYMQRQPLGMNIDQVIVLPTRGNPEITHRFAAFEQALKNSPDIQSTTISELVPGEQVYGFACKFEDQEFAANYASNPVGYDYFETYQMTLLAGRTFLRDLQTDTIEKAIINEALARELGWDDPNEAIHKRFDFGNDGVTTGEVIGVVKDAHFNSLRQNIRPMLFFISPMFYHRISIRVNTDNMQASLDQIEETWRQFFPDLPFEYFFADAHFGKQYITDQRLAHAFTYFVTIAILLAAIGLISLSALMIRRRVKEIAIRKVIGATTSGLTRMLTGEFVKLVVFAMIIAFPLAWYAMNTWLKTYAFRIEIPIWVFIVSGIIAIIVVVLSVSIQSVKAALNNPVTSLRSE